MGTSLWRLGFVALVSVLLMAPAAFAAEKELARDDGKREGKQSAAGTGHLVSFEAPKGRWYVQTVRIHGQRYGSGYDAKETKFKVSICDGKLVPISTFEVPYIHFPPGRWTWVDVRLPRAVGVPRAFFVVAAFDPTPTKGIFVGWTKTTESHSALGLPGTTPRPVEDKEWMIRATVSKRPPKGTVKELLLTLDAGEREGQKSIGGGGHVIEMAKPSGTWWIQSVMLYGQRYGGDYNPRTTMFDVSIADGKMNALTTTKARYSRFEREWSWVDVPLEKPVAAPRKFCVAVDFNPESTRGIYLGYAAAAKPRSSTGRVGQRGTPFADGEWMIRVRLVSEEPEPPEPEPLGNDPKVYREDFEFLKRTVRDNFPALEKKGVDWDAVCEVWQERFVAAKTDEAHILNAHQLLAVLGDMHTGVMDSEIPVPVPAFEGQYGAGLWIAREGDHLVLRALMAGHAHEKELSPGALLLDIDGVAAPIVHERVRRHLKTWYGWSSNHFLDARLSTQFFPFGTMRSVRTRFLNPDGHVVQVDLDRWGPKGKGLSRARLTVPADVELEGKVVSSRLAVDIGYLRILGGMNESTKEAFFDHMSRLKGVRAIVLDCRGMGGGGDGAAWAMAGRFFSSKIPFKHDPVLKPSGEWQFEGPLVMLQDEREVSSAETFTWALAETKRAVTVGRSTGGATIIPRTFEVPSKIFTFRLGCRDRETSVAGVHPEGIGTPPDVYVATNAALLATQPDPALAAGYDIARMIIMGAPRSTVVDTYAGVLGMDPVRLQRSVPIWRTMGKTKDLRFTDLTEGLVDRMVAWGIESVLNNANRMPDVDAQGRDLSRLADVALACGRAQAASQAVAASTKLEAERHAQAAWHRMLERDFPPQAEDVDAYLEAHDGTRWATAVAHAFD